MKCRVALDELEYDQRQQKLIELTDYEIADVITDASELANVLEFDDDLVDALTGLCLINDKDLTPENRVVVEVIKNQATKFLLSNRW